MKYRTNIRHLTWITLLIINVCLLSCERNKQLTPEAKVHYEIPRAVLQENSQAFDMLAVLMGEYQENIGFIGDIWIRAKVTNNTKYSFKDLVLLSVKAKDCEIIEDEAGNRWPNKGVLLTSPLALPRLLWQPGETIILTAEIPDDEGYGWEFLVYLTKTLRLPANEPVKIDQYVSMLYDTVFPIDCLRKNCPYKKLPKGDSSYCGQREERE